MKHFCFLFVCPGIPGDQNLACRILNVKGQTQRSPGDEMLLPLSPKSTLSWAG